MAKNNLTEKYNQSSNDQLIEIITSQRQSYTSETIEVIEEILTSRGVDIPEPASEFESSEEEEDGLFDIGANIENMASELKEEEIEKDIAVIEKINELSDEDLISEFHSISQKIIGQGRFDNADPTLKLDNYHRHYTKIYEEKKLPIPSEYKDEIKKSNKIYFLAIHRRLRNRGLLNLVLGILLLVAGIGITLASRGTSIFYGAVLVGLFQLGRGIILLFKALVFKDKIKHKLT